MTIFDPNNELPDLIKEYTLIRLEALDRLFPFTATSFIEDMMDDWKEESLQMKENEEKCLNRNFPRRIKYNIHKDLGCYFSPIYTDSALFLKREIEPLNHTLNKKEAISFKFLKDTWNNLGKRKKLQKKTCNLTISGELTIESDSKKEIIDQIDKFKSIGLDVVNYDITDVHHDTFSMFRCNVYLRL